MTRMIGIKLIKNRISAKLTKRKTSKKGAYRMEKDSKADRMQFSNEAGLDKDKARSGEPLIHSINEQDAKLLNKLQRNGSATDKYYSDSSFLVSTSSAL